MFGPSSLKIHGSLYPVLRLFMWLLIKEENDDFNANTCGFISSFISCLEKYSARIEVMYMIMQHVQIENGILALISNDRRDSMIGVSSQESMILCDEKLYQR